MWIASRCYYFKNHIITSMPFYEVWVRSNHYHGRSGLTYSSDSPVKIGKIVSVPLRNEVVAAVVMASSQKPKMPTKDILGVSALPPLPQSTLSLMRWLKDYYPAPLGVITQQFIPSSVMSLSPKSDLKAKMDFNTADLPKLTKEQNEALAAITNADTYLLHGRTGSGKTRIYLELAIKELRSGRSVIVLTPEISLTTQLEAEFKSVFGSRVYLLHSTLPPKARAETWANMLNAKSPLVVIGPRSAIFAPLQNIGLIVIDEEHEPAYKQEQAPYYVTSRVAAKVRELSDAKLILGSATPLISDYYQAKVRAKPIIRLDKLARASKHTLSVLVVDRKDRELFSRSAYFSEPLIEAMKQALAAGEQSLIYLNRRGTARAVICAHCGWQAKCPHCALPLTYHGDAHILRCHICGFKSTAPTTCPDCKQADIKYLSIGTKAVVTEVERLFPEARVVRFDSDQSKADRLEKRYLEVRDGGVDIIVGTQLLAKGLDLPRLSVVGVLLADTSLQLPDYSASERTFQLISQVSGRVGRGHLSGSSIIQTYQPEASAIKAATSGNWEEFYAYELGERRAFGFPPFKHLLKLSITRSSPQSAEKAAKSLAGKIKGVVVEGPAPSFHEKQGNKYRWQLVIKADKRSSLLDIIASLPSGWSWDIDPADLI